MCVHKVVLYCQYWALARLVLSDPMAVRTVSTLEDLVFSHNLISGLHLRSTTIVFYFRQKKLVHGMIECCFFVFLILTLCELVAGGSAT